MRAKAQEMQTPVKSCSTLESGLPDCEDQAAKLVAELGELQDAYESRNQRTLILEGELFSQRREHQVLSRKLDKITSEFASSNAALEAERVIVIAKSEEIGALQLKLGVRDAEVVSLREREVGLHRELCNLRIEQQSLTNARDHVALELEESRKALDAERLLTGARSEENVLLQVELTARENEVCRLQKEVEGLRGEMTLRFSEMSVLTQLCEEADRKLDQSEGVVRTQEALLATAESSLAEAQKSADVAQLEAGDLAKLLAAREMELAETRDVLSLVQRKIRKKVARVEVLETELAEAHKKLSAIEFEASVLEKRTAEIVGSASWRLTKPLRRVTRAIRRLGINVHQDTQ